MFTFTLHDFLLTAAAAAACTVCWEAPWATVCVAPENRLSPENLSFLGSSCNREPQFVPRLLISCHQALEFCVEASGCQKGVDICEPVAEEGVSLCLSPAKPGQAYHTENKEEATVITIEAL